MKELLELKQTLRQIEGLLAGRDGIGEVIVLLLKAKNQIEEQIRVKSYE
jgi:predicted component of type VI protein secretion system